MFGTRADDDLFCIGMNSFVPSQMELEGFPQFEQPGVRGFLKNGTAVIVETFRTVLANTEKGNAKASEWYDW